MYLQSQDIARQSQRTFRMVNFGDFCYKNEIETRFMIQMTKGEDKGTSYSPF